MFFEGRDELTHLYTNLSASHAPRFSPILTHLRNNLRQRRPLETQTRVPLYAERNLHAALKLGLARVRIRQVFDEVPRRLLVALLRYDDVRFVVVCARLGVDARYLLDQM